MDLEAATRAWRAMGPGLEVLDAAAAAAKYGVDTTALQRRFLGALRLEHGELVTDVMRIASRFGVPVYPVSTGRNWGYGTALPVRDDCMVLDLSGLTRIVEFDAELGIVTLEPGVTQQMLADFLDRGRHPFLLPVTGAGPQCSLVGNALERGYGITPEGDHFAAVTNIEAVLADGSVYRGMLRELAGDDLGRLFKWGVGPYCDGLFTQSGYGVVTRMSIALARRPQCIKAVFFGVRDDSLLEEAVKRVRDILAALPGVVGGINLMNRRRVLAMAAPYPADQVGANGLITPAAVEAMGRAYQVMPWTGFGTLYGTSRVVRAAQREIRRALAGVASRVVFLSMGQAQFLARLTQKLPGSLGARVGKTAATIAQSLELVEGRPNETALPLCYWRGGSMPPQGTPLDPARDGCGLMWYAPLVPMLPGTVRKYVEMVEEQCQRHGIEPLITLTSLNARLFDSTVPILFRRDDATEAAAAQACLAALSEAGRALGTHPYRLGVQEMAKLGDRDRASADLSQRLKAALDPQGLIAPGRYE